MDDVIITESRPNDVLNALHESAHAEREYLFASRNAEPDDLVLVAWLGDEAVGYIAATDQRADGLLVWEHLVVPAHRGEGLGQRLLREAAKRAMPGAVVVVDPFGELDPDRIVDYYRRVGFSRDDAKGGIWATASDVLRASTPPQDQGLETSISVRALLASKAPGAVTMAPSANIRDAIALLNEQRIGAVVISSDGNRIEGILAERDILLALDDHGSAALDLTIGSASTTDVMTCTVDDSISLAMELMTAKRIRHIPVTETGRLVGVVSIGDIVAHRLGSLDAAEPDVSAV